MVGFQLLERHAAGVSLTERGRRLFQGTEPAFELLESTMADVSRRARRHSLAVSLPTALATRWLVPRLADFKRRHPDIALFLDTTDDLIDFENTEIDVAIRFARPQVGGCHMTKIMDESLVAVVSPQLMAHVKETKTKPSLNDFPILEDTFDSRWEEWIALSQQSASRPELNFIKFTDSAVLAAAAVNGQGVALIRKVMVKDDLAQGRLVLFNGVEVRLERQLLFLCRESERLTPEISALRRWILELS